MVVANCSAVKRKVIDYGDLFQRIRPAREKISEYYYWAEDAIALFGVAILLSLQQPAMRRRCRVYGTYDPHLLYLRPIVFRLAPIVCYYRRLR